MMMMKMRGMIKTIMIIVIVAFAATIFFAWGMDLSGSRGMTGKPNVGTIDNHVIPYQAFERAVETERQKQTEQMGGDLTPEQSRMVPRKVFEENVQRLLLQKVFKEMSLSGSAEEIYQQIRNNPPEGITKNPYFQTDSVFDTAKLEKFLNTPDNLDNEGMQEYESHLRDFLIPLQQLSALIEAGTMITKAEVARYYRAEYERAVFEYAMLNSRLFPVAPSEITREMIERYYKAHCDSFISDEMAQVYFIRIPKSATPQDEEAIRAEMVDRKKRLESGEISFAEEAKIFSDDKASAQSGGDLGWFSHGSMAPEFEQVAFALDTGKISGPVRTQFGYHLIQVEEKEKAKDGERIHARHILRKVAASAETEDSLMNVADSLRQAVVSTSINEVCKTAAWFKLDSIGPYTRDSMAHIMGNVQGFTYFAFTKKEGAIVDKPLDVADGFYIAQIIKKYAKGLMPLAASQEKIRMILQDSIQVARGSARLKALLSQNPSIAGLSKIDSTIASGSTDTVVLTMYIPVLGKDNPATHAAFALPQGKTSDIINYQGALYVVKTVWRQEIKDIPWDSPAMEMIRRQIIEQTKQITYFEWYLNYKKSIKIQDNLNQFYID
jgi:peptidyl-prolyl cis-trans isomerase D